MEIIAKHLPTEGYNKLQLLNELCLISWEGKNENILQIHFVLMGSFPAPALEVKLNVCGTSSRLTETVSLISSLQMDILK